MSTSSTNTSDYTCIRELHFSAGHRVMGHENVCANMHGHNYTAWIYAKPKDGLLDSLARVIDFSVLKQILGGWLDTNWDHAFIYNSLDTAVELGLDAFDDAILASQPNAKIQKRYLLPTNPTAEGMADYLVNTICPELFVGTNVEIVKILLFETERCAGEVVKR